MKKIYLISFPLKTPPHSQWSLFHFKGFYKGSKIEEIAVWSEDFRFNKNHDYLLLLDVVSLKGARLIAHLIEAKNISNLNVNF